MKRNVTKSEQNYNNWLFAILALCIGSYPLMSLVILFNNYLPLIINGSFITMHDSAMSLFIINFFELVANVLFILLSLCVLMLFFERSRYFPSFIIMFYFINVLYFMTDYVVGGFSHSIKYFKGILGVFIAFTMLLTLFLLKSEKVKDFFIK